MRQAEVLRQARRVNKRECKADDRGDMGRKQEKQSRRQQGEHGANLQQTKPETSGKLDL